MAKQFFPFHLWSRRQNEEEHQTLCYYGHGLQTVLRTGGPSRRYMSHSLALRLRLHPIIKTLSFGHRPETVSPGDQLDSLEVGNGKKVQVSGGLGDGRPGEFSFSAELGGTKLLSGQMGPVHRRLLLLHQPLKNIPKVIQCNPSLYSDICLWWHTIPLTPVNHPTGTETLCSSSTVFKW